MQNFLPDRSDADRLEILTDSADHIEETTFYKNLTEDDLTIKREWRRYPRFRSRRSS